MFLTNFSLVFPFFMPSRSSLKSVGSDSLLSLFTKEWPWANRSRCSFKRATGSSSIRSLMTKKQREQCALFHNHFFAHKRSLKNRWANSQPCPTNISHTTCVCHSGTGPTYTYLSCHELKSPRNRPIRQLSYHSLKSRRNWLKTKWKCKMTRFICTKKPISSHAPWWTMRLVICWRWLIFSPFLMIDVLRSALSSPLHCLRYNQYTYFIPAYPQGWSGGGAWLDLLYVEMQGLILCPLPPPSPPPLSR